jgi:hypothetical protein
MSLNLLWQAPKDFATLNDFSFTNADNHLQIIRAIQAQTGKTLSSLILDPIPTPLTSEWAQRHQAMHNAMNAALGLQSQDFTGFNLQDQNGLSSWISDHANEHVRICQILKIG